MEQGRISLNAAQLDFLQLLGHIKTEEELDELRQIVSDFYARKAEKAMDSRTVEQRKGRGNTQYTSAIHNTPFPELLMLKL